MWCFPERQHHVCSRSCSCYVQMIWKMIVSITGALVARAVKGYYQLQFNHPLPLFASKQYKWCKQCKQFMGQYYLHFLWYFFETENQCVHPMRNDRSANDLRILGTLVGMVALCTWECIRNVAGLQQCRQEYQFDDFQHVCFCLKGLMNTKNELAKQ